MSMNRVYFLTFLALFGVLKLGYAYQWDEISPDDLAATECEYDPTSAAEVLYKEIIGVMREISVHLHQISDLRLG